MLCKCSPTNLYHLSSLTCKTNGVTQFLRLALYPFCSPGRLQTHNLCVTGSARIYSRRNTLSHLRHHSFFPWSVLGISGIPYCLISAHSVLWKTFAGSVLVSITIFHHDNSPFISFIYQYMKKQKQIEGKIVPG